MEYCSSVSWEHFYPLRGVHYLALTFLSASPECSKRRFLLRCGGFAKVQVFYSRLLRAIRPGPWDATSELPAGFILASASFPMNVPLSSISLGQIYCHTDSHRREP